MEQLKNTTLQVLVFLLYLTLSHGYRLSGANIGIRIREVAEEALGGHAIEEEMTTKAFFTTKVPDGNYIVESLVAQLGERFDKYNQAVIALRDEAQSLYSDTSISNTPVDDECCTVKPSDDRLSYDSIFRKNVDKHQLCYRLARSIDRNNVGHLEFAPKNLTLTMRQNAARIPNLGWQYYSTEQGVHHIYPRKTNDDCFYYDPRQRPWYADTNAPIAKEIVIVVDFTRFTDTFPNIEAVEILINTTNPNDRLAMVAVGNPNPTVPTGGCYSRQLALATRQNKNIFLKFARELKSSGGKKGSDYKQAFTRAFNYFKQEQRKQEEGSQRRRLLIFMTDSNPRDASRHEDIEAHIQGLNDELGTNSSVVIQTYSFGKDIRASTRELLKSLAEQTEFITISGVHKRGVYNHVESEKDIRAQLTSYYNSFAESQRLKRPVVSYPYEDFSGLGTIISLCLPVHDEQDNLKGITCIDAKVEDIFYNVTYFQKGKNAYAFLIDDKGTTISHPRMPPPRKTNTIFIHISSLEKEATSSGIIDSMLKGESNWRSLYVRMPMAGGSTYGQYLDSSTVPATYFWRRVPHSNYSICVVLTGKDADMRVRLLDNVNIRQTNYLHHWALTERPPNGICAHQEALSIKEQSTVKFEGNALQELEYIASRKLEVDTYKSYFAGDGLDVDTFRQGTSEWVYLSGLVDNVWKMQTRAANYDRKIYWRHLVLQAGVIRIYPGTIFSASYHPAKLAWYKSAIETPESVVLTQSRSPAGSVVVLSRAISVGIPHRRPIGVIAGEFRPFFFYDLLIKTYESCSMEDHRCFILDGKGNILVHKMMESDESVHILHMEPSIAKFLIQKKHLQETACLDFITFKTQKSWILSIEDFIVTGPTFEIYTVFGSNIFIGIAWGEPPAKAQSSSDVIECPRHFDQPICFDELKFDYCNNTITWDQGSNSVTCPPSPTVFPVAVEEAAAPNDTESCYSSKCDQTEFEMECRQLIDCQWCYDQESKSQEKVCRRVEQCSTVAPPYTSLLLTVLLPVLLALLLIAIVVAVVIRVKWGCGRCVCQNCQRSDSTRHHLGYSDSEIPEIQMHTEDKPRVEHRKRYVTQASNERGRIPTPDEQRMTEEVQEANGGFVNAAFEIEPDTIIRQSPDVPLSQSNQDLHQLPLRRNLVNSSTVLPQYLPRRAAPAPQADMQEDNNDKQPAEVEAARSHTLDQTTRPNIRPKPKMKDVTSPPPPIPKAHTFPSVTSNPQRALYVNHEAEALRNHDRVRDSSNSLALSLPRDLLRSGNPRDTTQKVVKKAPPGHDEEHGPEGAYSCIYDLPIQANQNTADEVEEGISGLSGSVSTHESDEIPQQPQPERKKDSGFLSEHESSRSETQLKKPSSQ